MSLPAKFSSIRRRGASPHPSAAAFAALLFLVPGSSAAAETPSIASLLRAPVAMQIEVAAGAGRIAWLVQEGPVQRIWTAELPALESRVLVELPPDDGRPITQMRLSPDGALLVFLRGLPPSATGVDPNPASLVVRPERGLGLISTSGGTVRPLGPGTDPAFSPDGHTLTFVRNDTLMALDVSGPGSAAPRPLLTVKGSIDQVAWSPDGKRLALSNGRGAYAVIGLWAPGDDRIRWIAPEACEDVLPTWSPDGRRLAFVRMHGGELGRGHDVMDSEPFSIMIADPAAGTARAVWTSPAPADSQMQEVQPADALRWLGNDRLVFHSEHEGWAHVYVAALDGSPIRSLTPGAYEADASALSPDGRTLVVSTGESVLERRRLWKISLTDGRRAPLTGPDTLDTDPVFFPDGDHIAYRSASARSPQAVIVRSLGGSGSSLRLGPAPGPGFSAAGFVEPRAVTFPAPDGGTVHGILFTPPEAAGARPGPGVVYVHGGPVRQMLLGWHPMLHYGFHYLFNQVLAGRGYTVLAVNYRSGTGYGRAYREFPGRNTRGAAEYQDVLAAGRYLQSLAGVDPRRVGLYGPSFGGYLTALALGRNSDVFRAGVDWYGVHNWDRWARKADRGFIGTDFGTNPDDPAQMETARLSSGAAWVKTWRSPVLFIHGGDDRTVLVDETIDLAVKLRRRGVPVETLIFPDEQHGFALFENWNKALHATLDFLDRRLGAGTEKK
jgi:dipeptidyl aminopeptidase/acylaminoacyl peptidase